MCLIAFAYRARPGQALLLAANRDEFHDRPSRPAAPWPEAPAIVGGRDERQGGAWLALSAHRRLAAVTNVRRMEPVDPRAPSRGALVADFVRDGAGAEATAARLLPRADDYAGFNLLLWDGEALVYLSNRPAPQWRRLPSGVYGLSNASLDTPWPKLLRLRAATSAVVRGEAPERSLLEALSDREPPPDAELPDTGVGPDRERFLAPPFIAGPVYGTRASSLVSIPETGAMRFVERRHGPNGALLGESDLRVGAP